MKIGAYYHRQKYRLGTLVTGNIGLVRIFAGLPGDGRQTTVGWRYSVLSVVISLVPLEILRPALLYSDMESIVGFPPAAVSRLWLINYHENRTFVNIR